MTVLSATPDTDALTLVVVADLAAAPDRAWNLWADPRTLERWWGPPTWPATFDEHDMRPGGVARYYMTGPDGTRAHAHWTFTAIDEPTTLEIEDRFADERGEPDDGMPTVRMVVTLAPGGTGTIMTITSHFASADDLAQVLEMGMAEGMTLAVGQIDALLAEG